MSPPLDGYHDYAVFSVGASDWPTSQVLGPKPSSNNMHVFEHNVQTLQQVLWAKAEAIERRARLDHLKMTRKRSVRSQEDDEEIIVPASETPLVYSLHYAQQGRQNWEDERLPETMGRIKKLDVRKSNLYAEEDFF